MVSGFSPFLEVQSPQIEVSPTHSACLVRTREFLRVKSGKCCLLNLSNWLKVSLFPLLSSVLYIFFRYSPLLGEITILWRSSEFWLVLQFPSGVQGFWSTSKAWSGSFDRTIASRFRFLWVSTKAFVIFDLFYVFKISQGRYPTAHLGSVFLCCTMFGSGGEYFGSKVPIWCRYKTSSSIHEQIWWDSLLDYSTAASRPLQIFIAVCCPPFWQWPIDNLAEILLGA